MDELVEGEDDTMTALDEIDLARSRLDRLAKRIEREEEPT
jgi:2-methylcitrate dehydratase PrpD